MSCRPQVTAPFRSALYDLNLPHSFLLVYRYRDFIFIIDIKVFADEFMHTFFAPPLHRDVALGELANLVNR